MEPLLCRAFVAPGVWHSLTFRWSNCERANFPGNGAAAGKTHGAASPPFSPGSGQGPGASLTGEGGARRAHPGSLGCFSLKDNPAQPNPALPAPSTGVSMGGRHSEGRAHQTRAVFSFFSQKILMDGAFGMCFPTLPSVRVSCCPDPFILSHLSPWRRKQTKAWQG